MDTASLGERRRVRLILGLLGGAAVAALAALALGEYGFGGVAVVGSGVVVGLFVSEVTVSVSGLRSWAMALAGAVLAVAGMLGAAWTSTGHRLSTIPAAGWVAVAGAALAAGFRARPLRGEAGTRPGPPSTE